jgi:hypothetical protein
MTEISVIYGGKAILSKRDRQIGARQSAEARSLADAALLGAVFTVLAFGTLRFEPFEAEKVALLGLFACLIVTSGFLRWHEGIVSLFPRNPLLILVIGLMVCGGIATWIALDPTQSLTGSAYRSQGLWTLLFYGIVFWGACHARIHSWLLHALTMSAIPVCLWALIPLLSIGASRDYAYSTLGNENFLASWLVIVLLYGGFHWIVELRSWTRPFTRSQCLWLCILVGIGLLMFVTLFITGSRGALLGLLTALGLAVVCFAALYKQRRLIVGIFVGAILLGGAYAGASRLIPLNSQSPSFVRLLHPYDPTRIEAWNFVAGQFAEGLQLTDKAGQPDPFRGIRSVFGFGLDNIDQTQPTSTDAFGAFVDRYHNFVFDTVLQVGWVGFAIWASIFLVTVYLCLQRMNLIAMASLGRWLLTLLLGAGVGILLFHLIVPDASLGAVLPVGASFGTLGGLVVWIGAQAWRNRDQPWQTHDLMALAVLCIAAAQWIDNQFGFITVGSQVLWWVILGLFAGDTPSVQAATDSGEPGWMRVTAIAGLFTIFSLASGVPGSAFQVPYNTKPLLEILIITLVVGASGAILLGRFRFIHWGGVILLWAAFWGIREVIDRGIGTTFDAILNQQTPLNAFTLELPFLWLCLSAILLVILAMLVLNRATPHRSLYAIAAIFLMIGSVAYVTNTLSGILHNVANLVKTGGSDQTDALADFAYAEALQYSPTNLRLRMDWLYFTATRASKSANPADWEPAIVAQATALFQYAPYFQNSRPWREFMQFYPIPALP